MFYKKLLTWDYNASMMEALKFIKAEISESILYNIWLGLSYLWFIVQPKLNDDWILNLQD